MIMALATLFGTSLLAQDQSVIDRINKKGIEPSSMYWIKNNEMTTDYLQRISSLTQSDLGIVSEMAEEEIAELDKVTETFNKIIGKEKKQSKINKKLQKYFSDPQKAMAEFQKTVEMKARAVPRLPSGTLKPKRPPKNLLPSKPTTPFSPVALKLMPKSVM